MQRGGDIVFEIGGNVSGLVSAGRAGSSALAQMEKAAKTTEVQVRRLEQASTEFQRAVASTTGLDKLAKSARESAMAFEQLARSQDQMEALRSSIDPLYAASKRYEAALWQLDAALEAGAISAAQHERMLEMVGNAYLTAGGQAAAMTGRLGFLGNISGETRGQIQMLGQQVQDIAVQLAAGTSATTVFAQQGSQILSIFGPVGAVLGALAAIGLPLLGAAFASAATNASSLTEQMERQRAAADALVEATRTAQVEIDKLRFGVDEEYQVELLREQNRLRDEYNAKVAEMNRYLLTTADSLDRQKMVTEGMRAEIERVATAYNNNAKALAQQADRAATLAVMEGVRVQRANELKAKQEEAARAADRFRAIQEMIAKADISAPWRNVLGFIQNAINKANQYNAAAFAITQGGQAMDRYGGRGTQDSRPVTFGDGTVYAPPSVGGGGGGGGGGGEDPIVAELAALQESLLSQEEKQLASYERQQAMLEEALAKRKLTQEEYNALMERIQSDHQERMAEIDVWRYGDGLQKTEAFMGAMADALQGGNEKMQRISKAFAASEALINAWRAYNQTLADPSLPFVAKMAAGLKVLAAGMSAVRAIQGGGGGSASSARGTTAQTASQGQAQGPLQVMLNTYGAGDMIRAADFGMILDRLNAEAGDRGYRLMVGA